MQQWHSCECYILSCLFRSVSVSKKSNSWKDNKKKKLGNILTSLTHPRTAELVVSNIQLISIDDGTRMLVIQALWLVLDGARVGRSCGVRGRQRT